MTRALLLTVAVVFVLSMATTVSARGCPSYEGTVDHCLSVVKQTNNNSRCMFWSCVLQFCDAEFVQTTQHRYCRRKVTDRQLTLPWSPLLSTASTRHTPLSQSTPAVASPCGGGSGYQSATQIRHWLLDASLNVYYDRKNETYTEGDQRWSGIAGHVCPPRAPPFSDCSSTVTWIYWTLFGLGSDFMNGENWSAGYTGTLDQHGVNVTISTNDLAIGDLCFYYHPMHHVAIYVGNGMVVSHGMDPVGFYSYNYAPVDFCRRYI